MSSQRCAKPIRQIVENAGLEGSVVVEKVKTASAVTQGFDAEKNEYIDMMQAGIIDPTKVERIALQNAASIASLLLTTEALITDLPEEGKVGAPHPCRTAGTSRPPPWPRGATSG